MKSRAIYILLCVAVALAFHPLCSRAETDGFALGLFSSVKGVGITAETGSKSASFNSISVYAEIYDIILEKGNSVGIKGSFWHNYSILDSKLNHCDLEMYAGPGILMGYVKDRAVPYGFSFALGGDFGLRFIMRPNITFNLSINLELGLHLRRDGGDAYNKMAFYKNGVLAGCFPQFSITYRFGR